MRGLGSIPTGGNIFHWIFLFSRSKASAANIDNIVHFEKTLVIYRIPWIRFFHWISVPFRENSIDIASLPQCVVVYFRTDLLVFLYINLCVWTFQLDSSWIFQNHDTMRDSIYFHRLNLYYFCLSGVFGNSFLLFQYISKTLSCYLYQWEVSFLLAVNTS